MTKEMYLEMCATLGSTPIEDEIPVEAQDLPYQAQIALEIYSYLKDKWDGMSGLYMGKDLSYIKQIFEFWQVPEEEYKLTYIIISIIDNIRGKELEKSRPKD